MRLSTVLPLVSAVTLLVSCGHPPKDGERQLDEQSFRGKSGIGMAFNFQPSSNAWVVKQVWPGSPGESAGIRTGDHLVSYGGITLPLDAMTTANANCSESSPFTELSALTQISAVMEGTHPGDSVEVVVQRGTEAVRMSIQTKALLDLYQHAKSLSPAVPLGGICYYCKQGQCWYVQAGYLECDPCNNPTCRIG